MADDDSIAIVGAAGRFPGANNIEDFWSNLLNGVDSVGSAPSDRWYMRRHGNNQAGYLKCPVDEIDAEFFNISPKEASILHPQQRLLLEVVWEALENAGITQSSIKGSRKTGIYIGIFELCAGEYYQQLDQQKIGSKKYIYETIGSSWSGCTGRLSYFLNLHGPNHCVESACSSSAVAIHMGVESLKRGECNLVIVGGVSLLLDGVTTSLAISNRCKVFDAEADGFAPSEGIGIVILKRTSDAIKDNDLIMGCIRGSAIGHDGFTTSFGRPSSLSQSLVMKSALDSAGLSPDEIVLMEAHGTGTEVGDPIECSAIVDVFSTTNSRKRNKQLIISSSKANVGHSLSAAGITGLIKLILCLKHKVVPKQIHFNQLNPNIKNLDLIPSIICKENTMLERLDDDKPFIASMNSFGLTGMSAHIIIQEASSYNLATKQKLDQALLIQDRELHIITISAKNEKSLQDLYDKYATFLTNNPEVNLGDFAFNVNCTREHFVPFRSIFLSKTTNELNFKLSSKAPTIYNNLAHSSNLAGNNRKQQQQIVFLFTGYGSQYKGMGQSLYTSSSLFRKTFDYCESIFYSYFEISLKEYLWESNSNLNSTLYSPSAILCLEYCLSVLWTRGFKIQPDIVIGHSIGEYAAAVAAGILSFEDAMKLVVVRSQLITKYLVEDKDNESNNGCMMVVNGNESKEQLIDVVSEFSQQAETNQIIDIAAINSSNQIVVSGSKGSIELFAQYIMNNHHNDLSSEGKGGIQIQYLNNVKHAFHSRSMDCILNEFESLTSSIIMKDPKCIYVSSCLAKQLKNVEEDFKNIIGEDVGVHYWTYHLRNTVKYSDAINLILNDSEFNNSNFETNNSTKIFIEIGPKPILINLTKANCKGSENNNIYCPSLSSSDLVSWPTLLNSLGMLYTNSNKEINWAELDAGLIRKRMRIPNYPFQKQKYWCRSPSSSSISFHSNPNFSTHNGDNRNIIHPLLGYKLEVALSSTTNFENYLNSSCTNYLSDHKIESYVIMPGAAFLEMILAVAKFINSQIYNASKIDSLIRIDDFQIQNPLVLPEKAICLQTIVEKISNDKNPSNYNSYNLKIASKVEAELNELWNIHCKCNLIILNNEAKQDATNNNSDAEFKFDKHDSNYTLINPIDVLYNQLRTFIGAGASNTTNKFECLENIWLNSCKNEVIASIKMNHLTNPYNDDNSNKYIIHPIVLDGMFQLYWVWYQQQAQKTTTRNQNNMVVPIKIKKLDWFINNNNTIYYDSSEEGSINIIIKVNSLGLVSLYNTNSKELIVTMECIDIYETTVQKFIKSIHNNKFHSSESSGSNQVEQSHPNFYKEQWISIENNLINYLEPSPLNINKSLNELYKVQLENEEKNNGKIYKLNANAERLSEKLCLYLIINAFIKCGINLKFGDVISIHHLKDLLGPNSKLSQKQLNRYLIIFEQGKYIKVNKKSISKDSWICIKKFPTLAKLNLKIERIGISYKMNLSEFEKFDYSGLCYQGSKLSQILIGEIDILDVLYTSNSIFTPQEMYNSSLIGKWLCKMSAKSLGVILNQIQITNHGNNKFSKVQEEDEKFILRILEIGAGTGATTDYLIKLLEEQYRHIKYEYTFTDIGPLFIKHAKEKYSNNKSMQFQVLDIEKDPKEQGFAPHAYHIIIASNVIHATKDLNSSLINIRHLLISNGYLILCEIFNNRLSFDIGPMLTKGWWAFDDFRLSLNSPLVDSSTWIKLLSENGFSKSIVFNGLGNNNNKHIKSGGFGVIVSNASSDSVIHYNYNNVMNTNNKPTWLIFNHSTQEFVNSGKSLTNFITNRLKESGRSVIEIKPQLQQSTNNISNNTCASDSKYFINPNNPYPELELMLNSVSTKIDTIEGIIYFDKSNELNSFDSNFSNIKHLQDLKEIVETDTNCLLNLIQVIVKNDYMIPDKSKMLLITNGVLHIDRLQNNRLNPIGSPLGGLIRCFRNEYPELQSIHIDINCNTNNNIIKVGKNLFNLIWNNNWKSEVGILLNEKELLVPRLQYINTSNLQLVNQSELLNVPNRHNNKYQLIDELGGTVDSLIIKPMQQETIINSDNNNIEIEIEIDVKAAGLNFRDVLMNSGLIPYSDEQMKLGKGEPGFEFCGIITNIITETNNNNNANNSRFRKGDRVCGLILGGGLSSYIKLNNENLIMKIPINMSYTDGATIPSVFSTSYYSLIKLGNVKSTDSVLIHNGCGGIGLASIQILLNIIGVSPNNLYITAGSSKKRNYLQQVLGLKNVYNSRDTNYSRYILEATNGLGIDIVLNTITGTGFKESSLSTLKLNQNSRFIELSKINIWSEKEFKMIRPDVDYFSVDFYSRIQTQSKFSLEVKYIFEQLEILFNERQLKALPTTVYDFNQIRYAYKYLHSSKHIGKVVIKVEQDALFNKESLYLLIGGAGLIGLHLIEWMIKNGAKQFIVTGRRSYESLSKETQERINSLRNIRVDDDNNNNNNNVDIEYLSMDVSNYNECDQLIRNIESKTKYTLKGIFNLAGTLTDSLIINQNLYNFQATYSTKIYGSWNLHETTKHLALDYFILFSSFTSLIGLPGQSSYTASNCFLDSFTYYREYELGLKCIVHDWGLWSDGDGGGLGGNSSLLKKCSSTIIPFSPQGGISGFEIALKSKEIQLSITNMNLSACNEFLNLKSYLSLVVEQQQQQQERPLQQEQTLIRYDTPVSSTPNNTSTSTNNSIDFNKLADEIKLKCKPKMNEQELMNLHISVENLIEIAFKLNAGIDKDKKIDRNQSMGLLGLDSLMGMELRAQLSNLLGIRILPSLFEQNSNIKLLASFLVKLMLDKVPAA